MYTHVCTHTHTKKKKLIFYLTLNNQFYSILDFFPLILLMLIICFQFELALVLLLPPLNYYYYKCLIVKLSFHYISLSLSQWVSPSLWHLIAQRKKWRKLHPPPVCVSLIDIVVVTRRGVHLTSSPQIKLKKISAL